MISIARAVCLDCLVESGNCESNFVYCRLLVYTAPTFWAGWL
jgi:hypothetical protein